MPLTDELIEGIFSLQTDTGFNELALEIFQYQYNNNIVYQSFTDNLGVLPSRVTDYHQIPFLPAAFFKTHAIISGKKEPLLQFQSSGTAGKGSSKHVLIDPGIYKRSFLDCFRLFYGNPEEYTIIALLPSYLERKESSLVYMVAELILQSHNTQSGFYLDELDKLNEVLQTACTGQKKTLLLGVSFALLDFCEKYPGHIPGLIVMETGGMKGRRAELTREELHAFLKKGFGVDHIHSEYGMTELLSQSYSYGDGLFRSPPWMKILIRDSEDPLSWLEVNKTGGINIIDLANLYSCSFIATQDLGRIGNDGSFEVLGRFDHSDIRGCNLMVS